MFVFDVLSCILTKEATRADLAPTSTHFTRQTLGLDPEDHEAQEKLGILYDFVLNERRISQHDRVEIERMKKHLQLWGDRPLTQIFVWRLGDFSDEELMSVESKKRKRASVYSDTGPTASSPDVRASTSSQMTYHAPSPPPLHDLLPGPSTLGSSGGLPHTYYPGIQALRNLPSSQNGPFAGIRPPPTSASQTSSDEFTSDFDQAFAMWLDDENISKAAIRRLLNDPAMEPITSLLSWNSVGQMKEKLEGFETDEDEDEDGDGNGDVSNRW
ncbi:hypothetical protein D6D23_08578 [Aureobasidium pullulans]|nr:hypothetical protein D6D23_08578 [Aureobasidium pullulans]